MHQQFPSSPGREILSFKACVLTKSSMCAQLAYAVSPVKLLEKDDVLYAWRDRMMSAYGGIGKNAVGHPESL